MADTERLVIDHVGHHGDGVAIAAGARIYVPYTIGGDTVEVAPVPGHHPDRRRLIRVEAASPARIAPFCPHFGVCGGCATQHIDARAQVAFKQRALEDTLWHLGRVRPETMLPPIEGPAWGYRFRARLTVRRVVKKGGVLVGFHERGSSFVADMTECHTMPVFISDLLVPLAAALSEGLGRLIAWGVIELPVHLVPAPTRRSAARRRGGDPVSRIATAAAARRTGLTVTAALRMRALTHDSVGLSTAARQRNISGRVRLRSDGGTVRYRLTGRSWLTRSSSAKSETAVLRAKIGSR